MAKRILAILTMLVVLCTTILTSVSANTFADVKESDWFYNDVEYVRDNNLMSGTSDSEFSPSGKTTRGMIVTVLWRLDGSPVETGTDFEDVSKSDWYYDAVAWASSNGIVSGYGATFGPNDNATREQLAAIVYRYASYKKYDVSKEAELDKYTDAGEISSYAEKSLKWANASGLITGTSETTISPKNDVQRSQLAAILKRFCVNVVATPVATPEATATPTPTATPKPSSGGGGGGGNGGSTKPSSTPTPEPEATPEPTPEPTATPVPEIPVVSSDAVISVESVTASAGDEVEVVVNIENNPGILGLTLSLSYDSDAFELLSMENGDALSVLELTKPGNIAANPIKFLWDGVEVSGDDIKDGNILVLKFKVKDGAEAGDYDIKFKAESIVNNDLDYVKVAISNGKITIE